MSRQPRKPRDPELFDIEAGRRMAELFDRARVELGLSTDADLWRKLGVSRDTAQSWMRGERPPSRAVGSKVAAGLGIRYDDLLAVYEGRERSEVDPTTVIAALPSPTALIQVAAVAVAPGAPREVVVPKDWKASPSPYSYGIRTGDTLFLAGLVSRSGLDNQPVKGDIGVQVGHSSCWKMAATFAA